jgi:acyl carrier protein
MAQTVPTREQILAVVTKHLRDNLEDLDVEHLDTSRSMKDLGANSLDMVEVVSRTMRELRIKIPRSELSKLTNIDGLVDLLHRVALDNAR